MISALKATLLRIYRVFRPLPRRGLRSPKWTKRFIRWADRRGSGLAFIGLIAWGAVLAVAIFVWAWHAGTGRATGTPQWLVLLNRVAQGTLAVLVAGDRLAYGSRRWLRRKKLLIKRAARR